MVFSVSVTPVQSPFVPEQKVDEVESPQTEFDSRTQIDYPRRQPFERYLEKLVNPETQDIKPTLMKREQANYLKVPATKQNPYKYIRFERIGQLKQKELQRKEDDEARFCGKFTVTEKLPYNLRQRHTAACRLRQLIHEENVEELNKYGRLFPPNSLTAQPVGSLFNQLSRVLPQSNVGLGMRLLSTHGTESSVEGRQPTDDARSMDVDTESREQFSRIEGDQQGSAGRATTDSDVVERITGSPVMDSPLKPRQYEGMRDFLEDRRRVCLLELAVRTKAGEANRMDVIMQAEVDFLKREEQELLRKHEEHDRYLKSICQRTAEAISLAEGEAQKRNEMTERIKRARYKLAHLNAECVKLEEEYIRLSTYKEFLMRVAETFQEHHNGLKKLDKPSMEVTKDSAVEEKEESWFLVGRSKDREKEVGELLPVDTEQVDKSSLQSEEAPEEAPLLNFFSGPQDLVDILSELESNNLTLIENVQEQEEVCERVRAKATKLYDLLNVERTIVDNHINREKQNILNIRDNVDSIGTARNALADFVLLERYTKVFFLGDMSQFDNTECEYTFTAPGANRKTNTNKELSGKQSKAGNPQQEMADMRPTITTLLSAVQIQIQKVYSAVYGTNEGGARLDTLVMLRRLETTVDELGEMLTAYPRNLVVKAKRTVDERDRVNSRRRQKMEIQVAHERRLQKAMLKAREAPRWKYGRRVLERSRPPEVKRTLHIGATAAESDEENSLFQ